MNRLGTKVQNHEASDFYYFRFAEVIVQWFFEKGNEKHVDDGEADQAAEQYFYKAWSFALPGYYFGIGEPFAGCTGKQSFKKSIIDE